MSETTPLEVETHHETTTFEHFDRTWTVPTKQHLSHIKKMRDEIRTGIGNYNLLVAETFLPADEFDALCEIDPDEDALNEFAKKIITTLGLGSLGNS